VCPSVYLIVGSFCRPFRFFPTGLRVDSVFFLPGEGVVGAWPSIYQTLRLSDRRSICRPSRFFPTGLRLDAVFFLPGEGVAGAWVLDLTRPFRSL